jgi:transposase
MIEWQQRRIFLFSQEIDMRWGFECLSDSVRGQMKKNIMEGDLFLFLGKNPRRVKVLLFDGTGLVLVSKRLEKGRFQRLADFDWRREISLSELELIFQGTRINFAFQKKDFSFAAPSQVPRL